MTIYIISAVDLVLTALFAILNKYVWRGFAYFVLSLLMMLALAWAVWLVVMYFTKFKKETAEDYKQFKTETINREKITTEYYEENEPFYKKSFKRSLIKTKLFKWFVICFCVSVAVSFLVAMIFYK